MIQRFPASVPLSTIEGISWPAIPSPLASTVLAVMFQLEQTQWLSSERILALQMQQLEILLRYSSRNVPYYHQRLKLFTHLSQVPLTPELWRQIPFLSREDLRSAQEALLSRSIPKQHGGIRVASTSGSTGKPVSFYKSALTDFYWRVFTLREHLWHRRNVQGKLASIRYIGDKNAIPANGIRQPGWGPSTSLIFATGACVILDIRRSIQEQAVWLVKEQPNYILTYPTNLMALAKFFEKSGYKLENLREISTISETMTPEIRSICQEVFGVPVKDMYSSTEVGYIALQCPEHEHYHVQSENVLVEILKDNNEPCNPGEIGRVVITSLHNYASPLIRYDIGDYAEVGAPCPCGRGLPVIKKVMGRVRNMLIFPNGEQHWPSLTYKNFRDVAPIIQAQLIQQTLNEIDARFVVERPLSTNEEKQLKKAVQETLGYPFTVSLIFVNAIQRAKGGKYEEFISHVSN